MVHGQSVAQRWRQEDRASRRALQRLTCFIVVTGFATEAFGQTLTHVRVRNADAAAVAAGLEAEGFDIQHGSITPDSFEVIVSPAELRMLHERGLGVEVIARGRPFRDIQAEQRAPDGGVPPGYLTLTEIYAEMNARAAAFPALCRVVNLTQRYGTPPTFEGRHLFAVVISDNVQIEEDEPTALIVSCHHAREIVTPVIALHAIDEILNRYGVVPEITALVDEYEIWIAPVWNPDGYQYVFDEDNLWRKNRRVFAQGVGVDLNRNYPFGWSSPCAGTTGVNSQTYRGPSAASESETRTMVAFGRDRRFTKVADYHSFAREVRVGYGCWEHPFDAFLDAEAGALAATFPEYAAARSCCTAGDIHFHAANHGTHAFLWETATEFQPDYATAQAEAAGLLPGIILFLQRPVSINGHVTDAATGHPLEAAVTLAGVNFKNGETNGSGGPFGRYHMTVPPGEYTIEYAASGYVTQRRNVSVTQTSAQTLNVVLFAPVTCRRGDVNNDGTIDGRDVGSFAATMIAGGPPGTVAFCATDMDGDGTLEPAEDTALFVDCLVHEACP